MMRLLDITSLLSVVVGFFAGLVVLLILELFDVGFWITAAVLIVAAFLVRGAQYLSDRFSFWRLFSSRSERKMHDRLAARDRQIARFAVPLGMVLAFAAAQIWSPLQIMEALP
ncbi:MAG: hypothetical protein AAF230_00830 [Pseudomonadota bacterium]